MKSVFLAFVAAVFVLASCSKESGSYQFQLDSLPSVNIDGTPKVEPDKEKVMSLFELVPGPCEVKWKMIKKMPVGKNYAVETAIKLRLKHSVSIEPRVLNDIIEAHNMKPFELVFLDRDGRAIISFGPMGSVFNRVEDLIDENGESVFDANGIHTKSFYVDFFNFLQSEPGTEFELNCFQVCLQSKMANVDHIAEIQDIKGVGICWFTDDYWFTREIGVIK